MVTCLGDSDTPDSDDDLAPEASSRNTKSSSHCDDIDGWSDSDTEVNKGLLMAIV